MIRDLDGAETVHAGGEGPDTGHHEPVGGERHLRVGGQFDLGTDPLESTLGRAEIARAVVEKRYA